MQLPLSEHKACQGIQQECMATWEILKRVVQTGNKKATSKMAQEREAGYAIFYKILLLKNAASSALQNQKQLLQEQTL